MSTTTFTAHYERDSLADAWTVTISGVPGCHTYGRSLRQAQTRIREALALWLDVEPHTLQVRDELPADLTALAAGVARARQEVEAAGVRAYDETVDAVRQLTDLGLSRRDAAEVLGLSHQRIQQLLAAG
jgi:predicted RNase H-like HicB family nuclease